MAIGRTNTGGGGGTGATLTVRSRAGSTVTVSNGSKTYSKVVPSDNNVTFKGLAAGTWLVTVTGGDVPTDSYIVIDTDYTLDLRRTIPDFTYTGAFECVDGSDRAIDPTTYIGDDWKIRFLTSGILKFNDLHGTSKIDVFLVGGGSGATKSASHGAGGGGGGYTLTAAGVSIALGAEYPISIGGGGAVNAPGGITQAFGKSAEGGKCGNFRNGGDGGSGGGGGSNEAGIGAGKGGEDGKDGVTGEPGAVGGQGQGSTTREFGEATGKLYSSGGGGSWPRGSNGAAGGTGGGGQGMGANNASKPGTPNTGGGAGGSSSGESNVTRTGGSGIVVMRKAR